MKLWEWCSYSIWLMSLGAFLVAQMVKNLLAIQETWVWSLGWENPLDEGMVTHSSILAQRIPWTEEPGGLQSMRSQRVRNDRVTDTDWLNILRRGRDTRGMYAQRKYHLKWKRITVWQPRRETSKKPNSAITLILDSQFPKLWENKMFKTRWCIVIAVLINYH